MALVYFVDGSNVPEALGDAYATVADIDEALGAVASSCGWFQLDTTGKEDLIKAITKKFDGFLTYKGNPVDLTTPQPLEFPRTDLVYLAGFSQSDDDARAARYYSIDTQKKRLIQAVAVQIEADFQKGSISQSSVSQGREGVSDRAFNLHALAISPLRRFVE